jgi:hypothetical protein
VGRLFIDRPWLSCQQHHALNAGKLAPFLEEPAMSEPTDIDNDEEEFAEAR